jgi:hypothetical protein
MAQTQSTAQSQDNPLNQDGLCVLSLGQSSIFLAFHQLTCRIRRRRSPRSFYATHSQSVDGKGECRAQEGIAAFCKTVRTLRHDWRDEHRRVSIFRHAKIHLTVLGSLRLCSGALRWTSTSVSRLTQACSRRYSKRRVYL